MKEAHPCGSWPSRIDSGDLVRGALRLSSPRIRDGQLYWLEGRPSEGGRQVLMTAMLSVDHGASGSPGIRSLREVVPADANVRTRVHEYGGGEFAVSATRIFYFDEAAGRIFSADRNGNERVALSPMGARYADLVCSPDERWLIAVEEREREDAEAENRLVVFELAPIGESATQKAEAPRVVAAGHDFYASPSFDPRGAALAFLAWDHPNMPWNGTWLETVAWSSEGQAGDVIHRGGGPRESIFQPRYAPDGALLAVSDKAGWWNLWRYGEQGATPVHFVAAELGRPQWVFGQSTWDFTGDGRVVASVTRNGLDQLSNFDLTTGEETSSGSDFASIAGIEVRDGWVACIAGTVAHASGIYVGRLDAGALVRVRASTESDLPSESVSRAEARSVTLPNGRETYAFVYQPMSEVAKSGGGEKPPLLVKSHGGPTSATSAALDPRIQFWTSRGFAVADVNYGGSTGYGRAYRDQLEEKWGVIDVEDCVAVAEALAAEGLVDESRLAMSGGSAGGYTTLCALTFKDTFAAGASHYGIGDLEALVRDTHKFESRYTDWLVGPWPAEKARYVERSPLFHAEGLSCPVIFFQGLEDRVVPPNQAESMVAALARQGIAHAYVPFEREQHGFRRAENIRSALDGELYFYSTCFGFEAPRPDCVQVVRSASA